MSKNIKYLVAAPDGSILKRTSKRTYTHAIIGRPSFDAAMAYAVKLQDVDRSNHDFHVAMHAGTHQCAQKADWETQAAFEEKRARDVAEYGACLARAADRDAWAIVRRDDRVRQVNAKKAAGYFDTFQAFTFCGTPNLAAAQLRKFQGINVQGYEHGYEDVAAVAVTIKEGK